MKKILTTIGLVLLFLNASFAQSKVGPISFTYGQEITEDDEKIVRIAGETANRVYTLATRGKKYYVKVFDSADMALLHTTLVQLDEFEGKDLEFEDITIIEDTPYIFGSVYNNKQKKVTLFGFAINEDGSLSSSPEQIYSTTVTKKKERGAFYFRESPTGDRLLILHAALFDKKEQLQYGITLVDGNLQTKMNKLEQVPFEDRKDLEFSIVSMDVNVYQDVFLVINESYRDRKAKKNIEKFEVHAFKSNNGYEKEIINIDFTNREVINCEMLANQDNQLHLVGFYSSVRKSGKANKELKGIYTSSIDLNSNEVSSLNFNEFDYETKVKLIGERRAKKGKDVKPRYVSHSLIEQNNGGLIWLSEYQLVKTGSSAGIGPLAFTPITYVNNEIIVTAINPDGSIGWSNVVPKEQKASFTVVSLGLFGFSGNGSFNVSVGLSIPLGVLGKGPEYLSAIPIYNNGQLTVIINDNPRNVGVTDIEKIKLFGNYLKAVPVAFVFDNQGEMTRIDQENVQAQQIILRPNVYYRVAPDEYIIYSSRKKEDRLGRMRIEKE